MKIEALAEKILENITVNKENDEIVFQEVNGPSWKMYHDQECCESVYIKEIVGDLADLIGSPLLMAEETSNKFDEDDGTNTWTFYKFATIKGAVTISWYGASNGYYSENVEITKI